MKILLTGATGKIGQVIAQGLANRGAQLALHYYSHVEHLAEVDAIKIQADLRQVAGIAAFIEEVWKKLDGIDVLIHGASIFERMPLGEVTEAMWERAFALDLRAAFFLAQAVAKKMWESGGKILFFSDAAALDPYPSYLPYCIAKAGVDSLARGLAKVLAPRIVVHVVRPPGRNECVTEVTAQVMELIGGD